MYENLTKCYDSDYICTKMNKIPEFYVIIARKIFSRVFWGVRASTPSVSYVYTLSGILRKELSGSC